ncbi:sugar transferase [Agaribacterium sp. ZY112]|uniref:sugar transferase n=1 Tax=Agaribacterium sp. ZY112 TaxID=3233574 RepID=UPI003524AB20
MNNIENSIRIEKNIRENATFRVKRIFDISAAIAGLVITLPLWPILAIAIKLNSRGPVFFTQPRIGACFPTQTKVFNMIKFRSMVNNAEGESGAVWAGKNDSRVTAVGNFLRKTRLDELPQLINVLKGDMSIVGPRPERPGFYAKLEDQIPYFAERTYGLMPGITGFAQINQGYDTCIDDVRSKLSYDLSYSLALSSPISMLKTDINIAWKTIVVMVCGRGQ